MPAKKNKTKVKTKKTVKKAVVRKASRVAAKTVPTTPALRGASKIAASKPSKGASLNASVFDIKGKVAGRVSLPAEVFGAKINNPLMSQAVRVYLANQRQGTVKTKNRGEVNATTKKIWQQKGTGRARHGSKRAPIFVGGGVAFGPRPRDFSLLLSKKMKTLALFSALSSKLKDQELRIVKGLETITPKTKLMAQILENLGIEDGKRILLVTPKTSENVYRAARNIKGVEILSANTINAYKVLDNKLVLLMRDAVDAIQDTFVKRPHNATFMKLNVARHTGWLF